MADIQQIIFQTALQSGIDPYLALAVAQQESGFNPQAIGDGGYSFGLFQENTAGGAGSTYLNNGGTYEGFFDPVSSTQRFAERIKYAMSQLGPSATPGEIAYAAQRPADRVGYTTKINSLYGTLGGGGVSYDPGLFGEDQPPQPTDGGGGIGDIPVVGGLFNWVTGLFGGNQQGTPTGTAPITGPDSGTHTPVDHGPSIGVTNLGSGRILFRYADGFSEVKDYGTSGTTPGADYPSLASAAAKAGFYNADGTPDTKTYLAYQQSKLGGGTNATGVKIVNLGNGRYLSIGPNGIEERTFGGAEAGAAAATPPSLDPNRTAIVAYLRALLGQNALPYKGVGGPAEAPTAAPPPTPAAPAPVAAPAAIAPTPTLVSVPGSPGPIDISGGPFAQNPQGFLHQLNPALAPAPVIAPAVGVAAPAPMPAAVAAPTPEPKLPREDQLYGGLRVQ